MQMKEGRDLRESRKLFCWEHLLTFSLLSVPNQLLLLKAILRSMAPLFMVTIQLAEKQMSSINSLGAYRFVSCNRHCMPLMHNAYQNSMICYQIHLYSASFPRISILPSYMGFGSLVTPNSNGCQESKMSVSVFVCAYVHKHAYFNISWIHSIPRD